MKKNIMWAMVLGTLASPALASTPTVMVASATEQNTWIATYDAPSYQGSTGTIKFNDWGYKGPTGVAGGGGTAVGVNDYKVGAGYNDANRGQVQHVVTKAPDWQTSDALQGVVGDLYNTPPFQDGSMDGQTQFYKWGYTTPAESTFSAMKIDRAGNYYVAREDMSFGMYDTYNYRQYDTHNNLVGQQDFDTRINFKPYTVSDAAGWCGSTLKSNPNSLEVMAGQVTFDIAFDVYFDYTGIPPIFSSTQLIPGMVMRSYGDYTVDVTTALGDLQHYTGSAVGNNMNPNSIVEGVGGTLEEAYKNQVSFLGAGVIPTSVWVSADSFNSDGSRKMRTDHNPTTGESSQVWDVKIVDEGTVGAVKHSNSFGGYAFLMRADGKRTLDWISPDGHSIYTSTAAAAYTSIGQTAPVPVPAAAWLLGSGLLGLVGLARTRRKSV